MPHEVMQFKNFCVVAWVTIPIFAVLTCTVAWLVMHCRVILLKYLQHFLEFQMNVANTKPAVHVTEMGLEESRGEKKMQI